jgi:hypothetical protein
MQSICALKKLLNNHPGKSAVILEIGVSKLFIDSALGAKISQELLQSLQQLSFVNNLTKES